jgi:hypothetical protein
LWCSSNITTIKPSIQFANLRPNFATLKFTNSFTNSSTHPCAIACAYSETNCIAKPYSFSITNIIANLHSLPSTHLDSFTNPYQCDSNHATISTADTITHTNSNIAPIAAAYITTFDITHSHTYHSAHPFSFPHPYHGTHLLAHFL